MAVHIWRPNGLATMSLTVRQLACWADELQPSASDLGLAQRSLVDTLAGAIAARRSPLAAVASPLSEPGRWAALAHVLDFDDLHMPSITHISVVCVPTVLAADGSARDYLVGAGIMARLGSA